MVYALVLIAFVAGLFAGGIITIRSLVRKRAEQDDVLLLDERITDWPGWPEWKD